MTYLPLISEVKYHSLDDGPGIRSVVFFKGCPLSCWWCHNPETISPRAELGVTADHCPANCGNPCVAACPQKAISFVNPAVTINRYSCNLCEACIPACESGAISTIGESMPVNSLVQQLVRYQPFFNNSGGGVTLSGGEATLYADYCGELLQQLKEYGIHTLLESCGYFNFDRVAHKMLPYLDAVYFDIKLADRRLHQRYCGRSNRLILENFTKLLAQQSVHDFTLLPRVPLIPDITTTPENLYAIAEFLKQCGVHQVTLLPYNPLWLSKSEKIGATAKYQHDQWLAGNVLQQCRDAFADFDLV